MGKHLAESKKRKAFTSLILVNAIGTLLLKRGVLFVLPCFATRLLTVGCVVCQPEGRHCGSGSCRPVPHQ